MNNEKQSMKRAVVEAWFGLDQIFFGDKSPKECLEESSYQNYLTLKDSMLYNLFEIYKTIDYKTERSYDNINELKNIIKEEVEGIKDITMEGLKQGEHKDLLVESTAIFSENESIPKELASKAVVSRLSMSILLDNFLVIKAFKDFDKEQMDQLAENKELNFFIESHDKFRNLLVETVFSGQI